MISSSELIGHAFLRDVGVSFVSGFLSTLMIVLNVHYVQYSHLVDETKFAYHNENHSKARKMSVAYPIE